MRHIFDAYGLRAPRNDIDGNLNIYLIYELDSKHTNKLILIFYFL
jgi:hypothetical protein